MARTFTAEGKQLAKWVRSAFVVLALILYGYAFPELDRKYLVAILAVGWLVAEAAAWWWVQRRRSAKKRK